MRHPFEGIVTPVAPESSTQPGSTRRSVLKVLLSLFAGLFGFGAARANPPTERTRREAGASPSTTTTAPGEEEGGRPPTLPRREEGVRPPPTTSATSPQKLTTLALGEEGTRPPITTVPSREEGGKR